jgi:hypothetical protein
MLRWNAKKMHTLVRPTAVSRLMPVRYTIALSAQIFLAWQNQEMNHPFASTLLRNFKTWAQKNLSAFAFASN